MRLSLRNAGNELHVTILFERCEDEKSLFLHNHVREIKIIFMPVMLYISNVYIIISDISRTKSFLLLYIHSVKQVKSFYLIT